MTPLISVVMPVFNGEETVAKAMDSLVDQTFGNFELIVVDDGSTDSTAKILGRYTQDHRIRVITQTNAGVVAALNRGVLTARGRFIARADADDFYDSTRLEKQLQLLNDQPELSMCCTSFYKVFPDGENIFVQMPTSHEEILAAIFRSNIIMHSSVMFRKDMFEILGGYRADARHIEDWDLWFRMARCGRLGAIAEGLSFLRVRSDSVSAKNESYQTRKGLKLRFKLLLHGEVPASYIRHLIKPALKSLLGQRGLKLTRTTLGLRRYR